MAIQIASGIQNSVRDSIVYADDLEIAVRANGEEATSIIDKAGNLYPAGITVPTNAPSFVAFAAGNLTDNKWIGYRYVYAATERYPNLTATVINESTAPRGNPSPSLVFQITGGNRQVTISVDYVERYDVSEIWVFRTDYYDTEEEAEIAADGGLLFFVGSVDNVPGTGTVNFVDNNATVGVDQIEIDNFIAPTFRYTVYDGGYFLGIGNDPFEADVSWENDVVSLINLDDIWFSGRDGQYVTISGISEGGVDGQGTFIFKEVSNTTAYLTIDGETPEVLSPSTGTGTIKIVGPASTLYRSKFKNPLAWGKTDIVGDIRISRLYAVKVGTGRATAIFVFPGGELLKIDFKQPSKCYGLNLKLIDNETALLNSRFTLSEYSVSQHFSQFIATVQDRKKITWGYDEDSFAILQCDGGDQYPISEPVRLSLNPDVDPSRFKFMHGFCDERTQLNCIALPSVDANLASIDLIVAFHWPSQKWTTHRMMDLSATCVMTNPNPISLKQIIIGGTDTGLLGRIHSPDAFGIWLSKFSVITSSPTVNSVDVVNSFSLPDLRGHWVFVSNWITPNSAKPGQINYYICRVQDVFDAGNGSNRVQFDIVLDQNLESTSIDVSVVGYYLLVGCPFIKWEKVIDWGAPTKTLSLVEFWMLGINCSYGMVAISSQNDAALLTLMSEISNTITNTITDSPIAGNQSQFYRKTNLSSLKTPALIIRGIQPVPYDFAIDGMNLLPQ